MTPRGAKKRADPLASQWCGNMVAGAEGMQMIGEGAGHEFNGGTGEGAGGVLVVPAGIEGDLAHGKTDGKRRRIAVHDGFKTEPAAEFGGIADDVVAMLIAAVGKTAEMRNKSASPEAVFFWLESPCPQDCGQWRGLGPSSLATMSRLLVGLRRMALVQPKRRLMF